MKRQLVGFMTLVGVICSLSATVVASPLQPGESVIVTDQYVTVTGYIGDAVQVQFQDGSLRTYGKSQLYKTYGCEQRAQYPLCVGNTVMINGGDGAYLTIVGRTEDFQGVKYALRLEDGSIDTGYFRNMISLP